MGQRQTTSRFKPLPDGHKRIGFRLAYIRKCNGIAQERLAADVGITLAQLANVESGRVPLKAAAAWKLCQHDGLNIHPAWLASGHKEEIFPLLSEVQKKWFDQVVSAHGARTFLDFWDRYGFLFLQEYDDCFEQTARHGMIPKWDAADKDKVTLDKQPPLPDDSGVKEIRSLPKLLDELRRLTKDRGGKIALANAMRVTRQAVDQWLSGATKPTAEMTFKLISWVETQPTRTKQKPGSCLNNRQAKTRMKSSYENNHKSNPSR